MTTNAILFTFYDLACLAGYFWDLNYISDYTEKTTQNRFHVIILEASQGRIQGWGGGGGVVSWGCPFGGPPNFIKKEKDIAHAHANGLHFST